MLKSLAAIVSGLALVQGLAISQPDTLVKRDYSTDNAVALIYWYPVADCSIENSDIVRTYAVQGFNGSTYDPDNCDAGAPPYNIGNDLYDLDYTPLSFSVGTGFGTTNDNVCNKNNGYLGSVTFFLNCKPQPDPDDYSLTCPGSCEQAGWSHDSGYGTCVNLPSDINNGGYATAIEQRITNCRDGQVN